MNGEFEWSESGLQLLQVINSYIEQSGGRIALANAIMREDKEVFNLKLKQERQAAMPVRQRYQFTPEADQLLTENWNARTLQEIGDIINYRDRKRILQRGAELGLPPRDRYIYREGQRPKAVIIKFGEYEKRCHSITSAAAELGCQHSYVLKAIHKDYHVSGAKVRFA